MMKSFSEADKTVKRLVLDQRSNIWILKTVSGSRRDSSVLRSDLLSAS